MCCKVSLTDDFVLNNTTVTWRKTAYKLYRENLLFDIERARFPESQALAVALKKHPFNHPSITTANILRLARDIYTKPVRTEKKLLKACIVTGCNGFLNNDYICGLCDVSVCSECHEELGSEHVCNKEIVASVKALKVEGKPCPKCATLISKIDGCDQMWCTQCHVTFSWSTGLVETGHTHNPHYYEWMRFNGGLPRAPGDNCGLPGLSEIYRALPEYHRAFKNSIAIAISRSLRLFESICEAHRLIIHNEALRGPDVEPDNSDLRAVFMCGTHIDKAEMKKILQQRDKAYRKSIAKNHIYQMVYTVAGDIFRQLLIDKNVGQAHTALTNLLDYANDCLTRVAKAYTCVVDKYILAIPIQDEVQEPEEIRNLSLKAENKDLEAMVKLGDIYSENTEFWNPELAKKWYDTAEADILATYRSTTYRSTT